MLFWFFSHCNFTKKSHFPPFYPWKLARAACEQQEVVVSFARWRRGASDSRRALAKTHLKKAVNEQELTRVEDIAADPCLHMKKTNKQTTKQKSPRLWPFGFRGVAEVVNPSSGANGAAPAA